MPIHCGGVELGSVEAIVDMVASEAAHVIFRFGGGVKAALAGKFEVMAVGELDLAFPTPVIGVAISL